MLLGEIVKMESRDGNPVSRASSWTCGCSGLEDGQQGNLRLYSNTGALRPEATDREHTSSTSESTTRVQCTSRHGRSSGFPRCLGPAPYWAPCCALLSTTSPALHTSQLLFVSPLPREGGCGPERSRSLPRSPAVSTKDGI